MKLHHRQLKGTQTQRSQKPFRQTQCHVLNLWSGTIWGPLTIDLPKLMPRWVTDVFHVRRENSLTTSGPKDGNVSLRILDDRRRSSTIVEDSRRSSAIFSDRRRRRRGSIECERDGCDGVGRMYGKDVGRFGMRAPRVVRRVTDVVAEE